MAASDLALNDALWAVALVSSPRSSNRDPQIIQTKQGNHVFWGTPALNVAASLVSQKLRTRLRFLVV